jgi:glutamate-1-semialdehyde 2,1-aminomutase
MEQIAPAGPVYQAGTLSGNPLATAAGNAQLRYLEEEDPFGDLTHAAERLSRGVVSALTEAGIPATGCSVGSMWGVFFSQESIHSFEEAQGADLDTFRAFHRACLDRGVFLAPSPFEVGFVSTAHTSSVIDETLEVVRAAAREVAAL